METYYPNYGAVMKAGEVGEGKWIPEFLPQSATDIREVHNIDTNEIWLSFHFNSQELTAMVSSCKEVSESDFHYPRKRIGSWWPQTLVRHLNGKIQSSAPYIYYLCNNDGLMAIDAENNNAYYWEPAR